MRELALFVPALVPGGAEQVMLDLSRGFSAAGCDVLLIAGRVDPDLTSEAGARTTVVELGVSRVSRAVMPLARLLRARKPDAVLSTLSAGNVVAAAARRVSGLGTRLVLREANTPSILNRHDHSLQGWILRRAVPPAYRSADHIVAVSHGVRRDVMQWTGVSGDSVTVIYNPVATDQLHRLAAAPVSEPWFDKGMPVIVAMGRLVPQKDFGTLLRAFHQVRQSVEARLIILGDGAERAILEDLSKALGLSGDVRFRGHVPNPFPYLRAARLFVLSSRWEGLPNALIQALALGCPVVSTDCPCGPSEILEGGKFGALVPVGDPVSLAAAMVRALRTSRSDLVPGLRASLQRFDPARATQAYLQVLRGDTGETHG